MLNLYVENLCWVSYVFKILYEENVCVAANVSNVQERKVLFGKYVSQIIFRNYVWLVTSPKILSTQKLCVAYNVSETFLKFFINKMLLFLVTFLKLRVNKNVCVASNVSKILYKIPCVP